MGTKQEWLDAIDYSQIRCLAVMYCLTHYDLLSSLAYNKLTEIPAGFFSGISTIVTLYAAWSYHRLWVVSSMRVNGLTILNINCSGDDCRYEFTR